MTVSAITTKLCKNFSSDKDFSEVIKGGGIAFSAKILALVLGFVSNIIIAKYYGAESLGVVSFISAYVAIACLLANLGIPTSLARFIPEQISKYSMYQAVVIFKKCRHLTLMFSGFTCVILIVVNPYIISELELNKDLSFWLGVSVFVIFALNWNDINVTALRAFKDMRSFAIVQFFKPLTNLILLCFFIVMYDSQYAPVIAYNLSIIMTLFASFLLLKRYMGVGKSNEQPTNGTYTYNELLKISLPMLLANGMWVLLSQVDIAMISFFRELKDVGVYAITVKLATLVAFVFTSINLVLGPKIAELYFKSDLVSVFKVVKRTSKLIFWITAPIFTLLVLFGDWILLFMGSEFGNGYKALLVLLCSQFITSVCGPVGYFLSMTGEQSLFSKVMIMSVIINAVTNIILIPLYGILGASIATFITSLFWNVYCLIFIKIKFKHFIGYFPILSEFNSKLNSTS